MEGKSQLGVKIQGVKEGHMYIATNAMYIYALLQNRIVFPHFMWNNYYLSIIILVFTKYYLY